MTFLADLHARATRERRANLDAAHARMARWAAKHGDRLAAMHPDVALEVRQLVLARFIAEQPGGMSDQDMHQCRMRVASRLRLKRYGPCTGDEEAARQLRECLAAIEPAAKAA